MFSFPPDKGNVGTAAYLNVFPSIYRVLQVGARSALRCPTPLPPLAHPVCSRWLPVCMSSLLLT